MATLFEVIFRGAVDGLARQHGLSLDCARHVIDALDLTDASDLLYISDHPEHVASFDVEGNSNKLCGHTGWVVWWGPSETATTVQNGDPGHSGSIYSLKAAIKWAAGIVPA